MKLSERIKKYRQALGINQSELARRIGKKPHYINQIEKGVFKPSLKTLEKIAQSLNTHACVLLDENSICFYNETAIDPQYIEYIRKLIRILNEKNLYADVVKNVLDTGFEDIKARGLKKKAEGRKNNAPEK